ncbi:MAG: ParA family protein [Alicyclobacillaceae bacterium]|nr:ParA family protein [Alicyclobacillaceae bacterium]
MWIWVDMDSDRAQKMVALYARKGILVIPVTREQELPPRPVELVVMTPGWDTAFAKYLRETYNVPVLLSLPGASGAEDVPDGYDEVVPCPAQPSYLQKWAVATPTPSADKPPSKAPDTRAHPMEALDRMIESTRRKQTYTQKQQTITFEQPTEDIAKRATIITVAGVKGGVGKSTFSILLASNLHKKGGRTVLVDLDHMGNLARLLGVDPVVNTSRFEVLANTLADSEMEQNMIRTSYGFSLVPKGGTNPQGLSLDGTRRLLYLLSNYADYVILDTHPGRLVSTVEAMIGADVVCAVSGTDRSTWADLRDFFSVTQKPVKIVLNRVREKAAALADMRAILAKETGYPVIGALPEDDTLYAHVQAGERIEGGARLEAAMKGIRNQLFGAPKEDTAPSSPSGGGKKRWFR